MDFLSGERWPQPAETGWVSSMPRGRNWGGLDYIRGTMAKRNPQTLQVSQKRKNGHLDTADTLILILEVSGDQGAGWRGEMCLSLDLPHLTHSSLFLTSGNSLLFKVSTSKCGELGYLISDGGRHERRATSVDQGGREKTQLRNSLWVGALGHTAILPTALKGQKVLHPQNKTQTKKKCRL